jgi:uncharacterized protein
MRVALGALVGSVILAGGAPSARAEDLPPLPRAYFNDDAGLVSAAEARRLDQKLRQLDEETSTQIVVAVFPKLPSPSLEDFTVRTAESWRVGRQELDNGAIFFVFVEDRAMRIEVGYGLEGALPDALARRILDGEVVPRFRDGDWAGGLDAGIDAVVAAVRGEYTAPAPETPEGPSLAAILIVVALVIVFLLLVRFAAPGHPGRTYGGRGWRRDSSHWGGGRWGGGGTWGGGAGGGFMGGGGSFGGGGASSSW